MFFLWALLALVFVGCEKIKSYPEVPRVEYDAYKVSLSPDILQPELLNYDVTFKFRVEDGNGDIGLGQGDTLGVFAPKSKYYFNLFVALYRKVNGVYVKDANATGWNWRLSDKMIRTGGNKTLIADVEKTNTLLPDDFTAVDTVRFEFYVVDRALNSSDTIHTDDIPFRVQTDGYVKKTGN
jgi:hypothetical protein